MDRGMNSNKSNGYEIEFDIKHITLGVILVILLTTILFQYGQNSSLSADLALKRSEFNQYATKQEVLITSLNTSIWSLQAQNEQLSVEKDILQSETYNVTAKLTKQTKELQLIKTEVQSFREEIQESMKWFRQNSNINNSRLLDLREGAPKGTLKNWADIRSIVQFEGSDCVINLYSIAGILQLWGFESKDDSVTSNSSDYLQTLDSFISNRGGDCEDYSLYTKAVYNYFVSVCINRGYLKSSIKLVSLDKGDNSVEVYPFASYIWPSTKRFIHEIRGANMYVVCGTMTGEDSGHCVVALTNTKLEINNIVATLQDADLVEPQTGWYIGKLGRNATSYIYENGHPANPYIYLIITDSEILLYREDGWVGYSTFDAELASISTLRE